MKDKIVKYWEDWDKQRESWKKLKNELIRYVFATDTSEMGQKSTLPWTNSSVIPKITQIYDNLKANYMKALFPNNDWMRWVNEAKTDEARREAFVITGYLSKKLQQSKFHLEAEKTVDDFILYGNAFAGVEYVNTPSYTGPIMRRISPLDIVFNPNSTSFIDTPKIVRSIIPVDEFKARIENDALVDKALVENILSSGSKNVAYDFSERFQNKETDYLNALNEIGVVELLSYYGPVEGLSGRHTVVVLNREGVILQRPHPEWMRQDPIIGTSWRTRPDSLWGMSPLDNILGLQWRICHLENLRADVFDQISLPMIVTRGEVQDFKYEPGAVITLGEDGDISYLTPPTESLMADTQIALIEQRMEEMAGAPKMAMGFRTPGEKTAFEVQTLMQGANKVFQNKAERFEREFLIPLLESMLEVSRQQMAGAETVTFEYPPVGGEVTTTVTREDLKTSGEIKAYGSSRYAKQAKAAQELMQLLAFKQIPDIGVHLSGKRIAQKIAQAIDDPDLFVENAGVVEQTDIQRAMNNAEADMMEEMQVMAEEGL